MGTLSCGKICIYLLRTHYKKDQKRTCLMMIMRFFSDFLYKGICWGYSFELHQQVDAIQMSTHKIWCLYTEVKKKYTGCNLKTMEILDCALIGVCPVIRSNTAGLGGSFGCAVWLETRRSRVQPLPRSATFFHGDWSWNIFYDHSLPSADSRRAVVSFWRKNVHNTG